MITTSVGEAPTRSQSCHIGSSMRALVAITMRELFVPTGGRTFRILRSCVCCARPSGGLRLETAETEAKSAKAQQRVRAHASRWLQSTCCLSPIDSIAASCLVTVEAVALGTRGAPVLLKFGRRPQGPEKHGINLLGGGSASVAVGSASSSGGCQMLPAPVVLWGPPSPARWALDLRDGPHGSFGALPTPRHACEACRPFEAVCKLARKMLEHHPYKQCSGDSGVSA